MPATTTSTHRDSDRTLALRKQLLSYQAERPRDSSLAHAVNDALRFVGRLPATAALPQVALADDGEVNFHWRGNGLLIDIGFVGDGKMHFYVVDKAQGVDADASVRFSGDSLPHDIERTMPRLRGVFGACLHVTGPSQPASSASVSPSHISNCLGGSTSP